MRTQIALEPEDHAAVKAKAARLGITMAEYIRRLVAADLHSSGPAADVGSVIGLAGSGGSDIATEKDGAIESAISTRRPR